MDVEPIIHARQPLTLKGIPDGLLPALLAQLAKSSKGRSVMVARDDAQATMIAEAAVFFEPDLEVLNFPAWDCLPFDRASPASRIMADRLTTLRQLIEPRSKLPQLLVTTANAVLQRVMPPSMVTGLVQHLKPGSRIERDAMALALNANGYTRVDTVAEPGDYAVRGGLLDLYPAGESMAIRLDFFGDEIETIRRFDPVDQRSVGKSDGFTLMPVSETPLDPYSIKQFRQGYVDQFGGGALQDNLYQSISDGRRYQGQEHWQPLFVNGLVPLTDYLSSEDVIIFDGQVPATAAARFDQLTDHYEARLQALEDAKSNAYRPLKPEMLYLNAAEWGEFVKIWPVHVVSPFAGLDIFPLQEKEGQYGNLTARPARDFAIERTSGANVFDALRDDIATKTTPTILACYTEGSRERITGLLHDHGMAGAHKIDTAHDIPHLPKNYIGLALLALDHGFETDSYRILTEQDLLGDRLVRKRRKSRKADTFIQELSTLNPGDLVVHIDHGIGRYEGLQQITVSGAPHDCVALSYAGSDKLYLPVENIEVLTRYGSDGDGVQLDKLGGVGWQSRKAKLKERIKAIAGDLLKIAAMRQLKEAPVILPQAGAYEEFCARFPYAETDDQAKAITDVIEDLSVGRPMDRLVCGDVGFGKTEVALRAAVIAALDGHQVALVCPTTLLARQHYATFNERFKDLPLRVGQLSRLVTSGDTVRNKAELADGTLDIVIGTHALLSKQISFKRLGLVIVDEEQHFGVVHKERLKQLRTNVHVLTLTATPIPRTLQMALAGLRELSLIATPPIDRLAVRTYVMPWDGVTIREALLREHFRGGQSFYVCPRIADLAEIEEYLRTNIPEIKSITAHGQMAPSEIEARMSAFYDRQYDVLLSTTIIESGLDIPSANTMIIHRADQFGLAQLYQLRGRVGRSKLRGYAYLTTPDNKMMTVTAEKRLTVLSSLDGLGAGFQLASHDLDIRGAGNLLGDEQSGHIREIGFELYQNMLEEELLAARADAAGLARDDEEFSPQITVGASIFIAEEYVPDLSLRMALYRRLGDLKSRAEIDGFAAELIDRFGALPLELKNLLVVIETKIYCREAGIAKLEAGPRGALVTFRNNKFENLAGLVEFVTRNNGVAKLRPDSKLVYGQGWANDNAKLQGVMKLAKGLAKVASSV